MSDNFNETLKLRLAERNLSRISEELDIPRSLLQDWVHNDRSASLKNIEHINKLAKYLGLSLEEMLLGHCKQQKVVSSIRFMDEDRVYQVLITRED